MLSGKLCKRGKSSDGKKKWIDFITRGFCVKLAALLFALVFQAESYGAEAPEGKWLPGRGKWKIDGNRLRPETPSNAGKVIWFNIPPVTDFNASVKISGIKYPEPHPKKVFMDLGLVFRADNGTEERIILSHFGKRKSRIFQQTIFPGGKFHQKWWGFSELHKFAESCIEKPGSITLNVSVKGMNVLISIPELKFSMDSKLLPDTPVRGKIGLYAKNIDASFRDFKLEDKSKPLSANTDSMDERFELENDIVFSRNDFKARIHNRKSGQEKVPCEYIIKNESGKTLFKKIIDLNKYAQNEFVNLPVPEDLKNGEYEIALWFPGSNKVSCRKKTLILPEPLDLKKTENAWMNTTIKEHMGVPTLFIDGKAYPAPYHRHYINTRDTKSLMGLYRTYKAGIRVYLLEMLPGHSLPGKTVSDRADFMIKYMKKLALAMPDAKFILICCIKQPADLPVPEQFLFSDGLSKATTDVKRISHGAASLSSKQFIESGKKQIDELIAKIGASSVARKHVCGLFLTGGGFEGSWGPCGGKILVDVSPANKRAFSDWLKKKYGRQDVLRKAWNDANADIENPEIPDLKQRTSAVMGGFLDPVKSRKVIDFLKFNSSVGPDLCLVPLLNHLYDKTNGKVLAVEPAYISVTNLSSTSFTLRPLQNLKGPFAPLGLLQYYGRGPGWPAIYYSNAFFSARLHGQLVFIEYDIRTHKDPPGTPYRCGDDAACSIGIMRRGFAQSLCRGRFGLYYFDISGPHNFDDPELLKEISQEVKVAKKTLKFEYESAAEVLVVLDNRLRAVRSVVNPPVKKSIAKRKWAERIFENDLNAFNLRAMMRSGFPFDTVFSEDLFNKRCENYRLYIFAEQFYTEPKLRERIKYLTRRPGVTSMFVHAPGLVIPGQSLDLKNIDKLIGIKCGLTDKMTKMNASITDPRNPLTKGIKNGGRFSRLKRFGDPAAQAPQFYVDDPEAVPLAVYQDGKTAAAMKKLGRSNIVYSCVPVICPEFYRNLARFAGVHIYSERNDPMSATGNFIYVHADKNGKRTIKLKNKANVINAFTGKKLAVNNKNEISFNMKHGETVLFYIGKNSDLFLQDSKK